MKEFPQNSAADYQSHTTEPFGNLLATSFWLIVNGFGRCSIVIFGSGEKYCLKISLIGLFACLLDQQDQHFARPKKLSSVF